MPESFVRWVIRNEWVTRVADLVERRLMLVFARSLRRSTVQSLAELMAMEGAIDRSAIEEEVEHAVGRLRRYYGRAPA
ncbi:MAG: hypothetical protein D6725_02880 [Planctomycetota bacterium]|nr:MAG: hypothetical protein D6725_02880 [Planctomycetota bacterium]